MFLRTTFSRPAILRLVSVPLLVLALSVVALSSGCRSIRKEWDVPTGPAFQPRNFTGVGTLPASVHRVAVLPLHTDAWPAATIATIEAAFAAELIKVERFEVATMNREAMRTQFGVETVVSTAALPSDMLDRLRALHGADAVLFQELTHYSPYQPIAIGIRSKLVSAVDGRVLWSFDELFDGAQPSVAVAAREYHLDEGRRPHPVNDASSIMQSPSRFAKYVAHATFGTLPPRQTR